MSNPPSVAVVILNYNGKAFLEQFLPSVLANSYPELQVVVGDNASTDDSIAFLQTQPVTILENDQNYGFAEGYNRILRRVKADYYVLLNSDVEVSPNWIEPIIRWMEEDQKLAACQPKILAQHAKNTFEHAGASGGYMDRFGFCFCRGRIFNEVEQDKGQYSSHEKVFWASGAALFIRAELYERFQGLDGDFFAHMEEIDLCWRLQNSGYHIGVCPESVVYHVGGGTLGYESPRKVYLNFRNNLVMMQKNIQGFWNAFFVLFIRLFFDFFALLKFLADRKWEHALAVHRAHRYFFWNQAAIIRKRRKIQKQQAKKGIYQRSIVWDFFAKKKQHFSDLDPKAFTR